MCSSVDFSMPSAILWDLGPVCFAFPRQPVLKKEVRGRGPARRWTPHGVGELLAPASSLGTMESTPNLLAGTSLADRLLRALGLPSTSALVRPFFDTPLFFDGRLGFGASDRSFCPARTPGLGLSLERDTGQPWAS